MSPGSVLFAGAHGISLHVDWHTIDPSHPNQVPYTIDPLLGIETTPGTDAYEVLDAINGLTTRTITWAAPSRSIMKGDGASDSIGFDQGSSTLE